MITALNTKANILVKPNMRQSMISRATLSKVNHTGTHV